MFDFIFIFAYFSSFSFLFILFSIIKRAYNYGILQFGKDSKVKISQIKSKNYRGIYIRI